MRLEIGERLEGAGPVLQPGGYVVTSVVRETPWHTLYLGKKVFYNFDFTAKRVRETDDVEWLDVLIRTNRYPILDDPIYVQQRRALTRAEVRAILGNRHSNLWPEALDLLEISNTRDAFEFAEDPARSAEPVAVYTRPQGLFTPEWQQQILPISSILSVLAELLEFIEQAHGEGLLLLGLGPASLLIDASDRVHYLGTEMVLSQQNVLLKEATSSTAWQRLFPADRFPRGYSAPECFDPNRRPDVRADLYAWGTLAYGLLTGADLSKVAAEQGRLWATFTDWHFNELEKMLAQLPRNSLNGWAEQLGVDAERLLADWPKNFVTTFRMLLSDNPARRPTSVGQLRSWLIDPPPPPVTDLIALALEGDAAKLLLDCTGVEPGLEMTIQVARGTPPVLPTDGANVINAPLRPLVELRQVPPASEQVYFTAFTKRKKGERVAFSPGITAQLWQPTQEKLREWVETQAARMFDAHHIPPRISTVLAAVDPHLAAESLLASALPRVRAWGLRRLEQAVQAHGRLEIPSEALFWRCLAEPYAELRQSAALTLWKFHPHKADELLLRIIEALEASPIDAPIPLMQFLRQLSLTEDRIRTVLQQLETRRPTECPLCKMPLTLGERDAHLQADHGYVMYEGDVLPAETVYGRLWERTIQQQDRKAHGELMDLYVKLLNDGKTSETAVERYVGGLQRYLLGESRPGVGGSTLPVAVPYDAMLAYQRVLRQSPLFLPVARQLLASPQRRLREIGVQTVLPHIQDQLGAKGSVDDLRRVLNAVCDPLDQTDQQIYLCRQLAQIGVDQGMVHACIAALQEDRLVVCSECQSEVRARDLEVHLRRAHQVFQFRGTRRTYADMRTAMVKAICTLPVDLPAWKSLDSLAKDRHGDEADRYLVGWLYNYIKDVDTEARGNVFAAVTEVLAAAGAAERLVPLFAGTSKNAAWELIGQRLTLDLCPRLAPAPLTKLLPLIMPFLDAKELPRRSRENAGLALMRALGKDNPLAADMLRAYVARSSKKRGIEKLQLLEQRFGHSLILDAVVHELEDDIRMSCPRCETELRKKDMVEHLWDMHRLILDGQRVREPWRVIEDWLVDYGLEKDPQVLQRCRELALRDDPQSGLARLQRLLYRRGLRDRDLLNELKSLVKSKKTTLCPHCCASLTIESPPIVQPLTLESSLLKGYGYQLEVAERGLFPSLHIESPDAIIFRDREPGRFMTRWGGILFLMAPLAVFVFLVLYALTRNHFSPLIPAGIAAGIGLFGSIFTFLLWPSPAPARERLIKAAWNHLVPEILRAEMGRREWSFLHGLVEISEELEEFEINQDILLECCEEASEAGGADVLACVCLAALSRRSLADMREKDEEPYHYVVTLASECFKGKLPISFLSDLLTNFHGRDRSNWSKRELNTLTIQIANRAFAAEMDLDDWLNLGRAFPVLNGVLNLESRWHWQQFHALWSQLGRRPWETVGHAIPMVDLAKSPKKHDDMLSFYPDVLLYIPDANLVVGTKGVWIEGVCVTSYTPNAPVSVERTSAGYELMIDKIFIRCADDPKPYLSDIVRWLKWYYQDFLASVNTKPRPMIESKHRVWQLSKIACTECGKPLVPCPGDLGVALK